MGHPTASSTFRYLLQGRRVGTCEQLALVVNPSTLLYRRVVLSEPWSTGLPERERWVSEGGVFRLSTPSSLTADSRSGWSLRGTRPLNEAAASGTKPGASPHGVGRCLYQQTAASVEPLLVQFEIPCCHVYQQALSRKAHTAGRTSVWHRARIVLAIPPMERHLGG